MGRMKGIRSIFSALCAMFVALAWTSSSQALSLTYSGSSGNLSASASFNLSGSTLNIILTNTSSSDVLVPADVLTGLFFHTTNLLTPVSASLNGSSVFYGSIVTNVGEGWQYKSGVSAQGKNSGISAAGLSIFGPSGNFFSPGLHLNGLNYGILSASDNTGTGNGGITGHGPLIKNSVAYTLTANTPFSLSELGSTVVFQYGTSTTEPHFTGSCLHDCTPPPPPPCTDCTPPPHVVPEPSTWIMLVTGTLGLLGYGWSRRHAHQDAETSI
jgi:PEP-CTERM motif